MQKVNYRHLYDRGLFQINAEVDDEITDQPRPEEALQQDISVPWMIPVDRIFIDLGNLARLPDPEENIDVTNDEDRANDRMGRNN